jgi:hypothetical protein
VERSYSSEDVELKSLEEMPSSDMRPGLIWGRLVVSRPIGIHEHDERVVRLLIDDGRDPRSRVDQKTRSVDAHVKQLARSKRFDGPLKKPEEPAHALERRFDSRDRRLLPARPRLFLRRAALR